MGEIFAVGANVAVPGSRFCLNRFKFQSPRFRGWGSLGMLRLHTHGGEASCGQRNFRIFQAIAIMSHLRPKMLWLDPKPAETPSQTHTHRLKTP